MNSLFVCGLVLVAFAFLQGIAVGNENKWHLNKYGKVGIYEDNIRKTIENIREQLKHCTEIPPLDPFVMNNKQFKVQNSLLDVDLVATGEIDGLLGFNVSDLTMSLLMQFEFGFMFPSVTGKGTYNVTGLIDQTVDVDGDGEFDFEVTNFYFKFTGQFKPDDAKQFVVSNITTSSSLEAIRLNVTGVMYDKDLSLLISELVTESLPALIQTYQHTINTKAAPIVKAQFDNFLYNKTIAELLNFNETIC